MFAKILLSIAVVIIIGASLLSFRASKLRAMHKMANLHSQMASAQKQMWNLQTDIAQQSDPNTLKSKLTETGIVKDSNE